MRNKILIVLSLIALLIGFFIYQPILFPKKAYPSIEDRLPDAPIIGRINVVDLSDEIVPLLFEQKVAYRDLISTDFLLTQAKNGGINLQKPTYFYAVDENEIGVLFSVSDSSKVPNAIAKISSFFEVIDTMVNTQKVYKIDQFKIYIAFERNWLFVYKGSNFLKHFFQIKYADQTSRRKRWQDFLTDKHLENQALAISYRTKALAKKGLKYIALTGNIDSANVYLNAYVVDKAKLPFRNKLKGEGIPIDKNKSNYYVDLHVDIDSTIAFDETYFYDLISPYARKINFPLKELLAGWGGDLSIDLDKKVMVNESYIEAEFDDNFESIDIHKNRWVERNQFSFFITSNRPYYKTFVNQLFGRGFLRKEGDTHFFLTIPFINIVQKENSLSLFSGVYPKTSVVESLNAAEFIYDGDHFKFKINKITNNELRLNATIPFTYFAKRYGIKIGR